MHVAYVVNQVESNNASIWSCSSAQSLVDGFCNILLGHQDIWSLIRENQSNKKVFSLSMQEDMFIITVEIIASDAADMKNATTHVKSASCSYSPWSPRELVCESNYMEVSTGSTDRKVMKSKVRR